MLATGPIPAGQEATYHMRRVSAVAALPTGQLQRVTCRNRAVQRTSAVLPAAPFQASARCSHRAWPAT